MVNKPSYKVNKPLYERMLEFRYGGSDSQNYSRDLGFIDWVCRYIERIPSISREKEKGLFEKYRKSKDKKIATKIANNNIRFILGKSLQFANKGAALEELFNEAYQGYHSLLMTYKGKSRFLSLSLKKHLFNYLLRNQLVSQEKEAQGIFMREKLEDKLTRLYGRKPYAQEIYRICTEKPSTKKEKDFIGKLNKTEKGFIEENFSSLVESDINSTRHIYVRLDDRSENEISSYFSDENTIIDTVMRNNLKTALYDVMNKVLTPREEKVLEFYYVKELTLEGAGKELNLSKDWIRQIRKKALRKLFRTQRSGDGIGKFSSYAFGEKEHYLTLTGDRFGQFTDTIWENKELLRYFNGLFEGGEKHEQRGFLANLLKKFLD